jgi:hypothetical protein
VLVPARSVSDATPHVQMHLANGRMEALIRYPVIFGIIAWMPLVLSTICVT